MKPATYPDLQVLPMLPHETLSVGVDIGKQTYVAGFISETLLHRHQRIIASIGNIANFERVAQLRSSFRWAPRVAQSG